VNFDTVESAVAAKKALQHKDVLSSGTGIIRIGFAKATSQKAAEVSSLSPSSSSATTQQERPSPVNIPQAKDNPEQSKVPVASGPKHSTSESVETSNLSKIMNIMAEFGMDSDDGPVFAIGELSCSDLIARCFSPLPISVCTVSSHLTSSFSSLVGNRPICKYVSSIPAVAEPNANRKLDAPRLREVRKKLDNTHTSAKDIQAIAEECMSDIVELSSG
jgi:protein JSN1